MTILQAIADENLFRPFLGDSLDSWKPWGIALRCLYGRRVRSEKGRALIKQATGREASELPAEGFKSALFLTGRRSGKTRIASIVAGYEALFANHQSKLAPGEVGVVAVISPTRAQSAICWNYLRGLFASSPLLRQEVVDSVESSKVLKLRNGIQVEIITGDPKKSRGRTCVCVVIDETAFFGLDEESSCRSDVELIRSVRPSLATVDGRLICISSPYAKKGYCYSTYLKFHGDNRGVSASFSPAWSTLLWKLDSKAMNPLLSEKFIAAAYAEDPQAARSEFGASFREDVSEWAPRSLIESLVVRGRKELLPRPARYKYTAFADLSAGRHDDAALAIGHREDRKVIVDSLRVWKAPFDPNRVVFEQAEELKRWGLTRVCGDNFAGEFVAASFAANHIHYRKSDLPKSGLYKELLPRLCSAEIELLDNEQLVTQLSGLERRTRAGGADVVDHPPGGRDDAANVVAGLAVTLGRAPMVLGAVRLGNKDFMSQSSVNRVTT